MTCASSSSPSTGRPRDASCSFVLSACVYLHGRRWSALAVIGLIRRRRCRRRHPVTGGATRSRRPGEPCRGAQFFTGGIRRMLAALQHQHPPGGFACLYPCAAPSRRRTTPVAPNAVATPTAGPGPRRDGRRTDHAVAGADRRTGPQAPHRRRSCRAAGDRQGQVLRADQERRARDRRAADARGCPCPAPGWPGRPQGVTPRRAAEIDAFIERNRQPRAGSR